MLALASSAKGQKLVCPESGERGNYSKLSVRLCWHRDEIRHLKIWSPDHSVLLAVDGESGQLYKNGIPFGEKFGFLPDAEWLWSPDSRATILTSFVTYPTQVIAGVDLLNGTSEEVDVMRSIQEDFASRHPGLPCSGAVNVAGLTWLRGSKEAVLIAEIPASPRCEKADGYFEGYVVSVPQGKIMRHYSMRQTAAEFRNLLGPSLLEDIKSQQEEHEGK